MQVLSLMSQINSSHHAKRFLFCFKSSKKILQFFSLIFLFIFSYHFNDFFLSQKLKRQHTKYETVDSFKSHQYHFFPLMYKYYQAKERENEIEKPRKIIIYNDRIYLIVKYISKDRDRGISL